jgi:hypothetical protein
VRRPEAAARAVHGGVRDERVEARARELRPLLGRGLVALGRAHEAPLRLVPLSALGQRTPRGERGGEGVVEHAAAELGVIVGHVELRADGARVAAQRVEGAPGVQLAIDEPALLQPLAVARVHRRHLLGVLAPRAVARPVAQGARKAGGLDH